MPIPLTVLIRVSQFHDPVAQIPYANYLETWEKTKKNILEGMIL